MPITLYGIKNCDTMKKARAWLEAHEIEYAFHDYKKDGIAPKQLQAWADELGWEILLNRAGTSFRGLAERDKENITEKKSILLMASQPSLIKRPVLDLGKKRMVGFKPDSYAAAFKIG